MREASATNHSSSASSPSSFDVASDDDAEAARLQALHRYDILDTDVESAYTHVAELAAHVMDTPIAFVSLIEEDRQWMKACVGRTIKEIALDNTFCIYTIQSPGVTVVEDAAQHDRFADMPVVQGTDDTPGLRFYAGAPLETPDGYRVGTLCVLDTEPRPRPSDVKLGHLRRLAQIVVDELELRRETAERTKREQELRQTSQRAEVARAVARQAQERAEEAQERAEQASRLKSRFLAGVAHDLRSPLSVIHGFARLLQRTLSGTEADHAEKIHRAAEQLSAMATSLSDLARLESNNAGLDLTPTEIAPLVREAVETLSTRAEQAGIELEEDVRDEAVTARIDASALRRAIDNLVGNAIKYSAEGDRVTVRVAPGDHAGAVLTVSDTGPGIDPDFMPNVFEPFARNATETEGTGLGLAVTKELVEAMGGRITVESTLGEGTTFRLLLPPPQKDATPWWEERADAPSAAEPGSGWAETADATSDAGAELDAAPDSDDSDSDDSDSDEPDPEAADSDAADPEVADDAQRGDERSPGTPHGGLLQRWTSDTGERRLRGLVDRLPGAVYRCTYDTDWISLYMGEGFRDICGIDPETLDPAGRSFKDVILPDDRDKIRAAVAEAVENRTFYSVEYRIRTDEGDIRWVEDNGRPVFSEDGSVRWLDGILLDVSGRREAEEALREMNETLEEKVKERTRQLRRLSADLAMAEQRERDQIARVIHDDLQQFLYGVQVETKMLVDGIDAHPDVEADELPVDPSRLEELLQQAIETTRGLTVDLAPPVLESDGLIEALQWLRSHMKDTRDFEMVLRGTGPSWTLPEELRMVLFQAVRELVRNACDHAEVDVAHVNVWTDDGDLYLRVRDDGIGFDPSEKIDKNTPRFGLHNVKERLRFFGATLDIDSRPGAGTECVICLPAREQSLDHPASVAANAAPASTADPDANPDTNPDDDPPASPSA